MAWPYSEMNGEMVNVRFVVRDHEMQGGNMALPKRLCKTFLGILFKDLYTKKSILLFLVLFWDPPL